MIDRIAPRNPWIAMQGNGSDTSYGFSAGNPGSRFVSPYLQANPGGGGGMQSYSPPPIDNYGASRPDVSSPAVTTSDYLTGNASWAQQQGMNAAQAAMAPQRIALQGQMAGYSTALAGAIANQGLETGYLNQNYGFANARNQLAQQANQVDIGANARQPGFLTALHNIAGQQYDLTRQGEAANAAQSQRALESNLTGRGAFTSVGGQQGRYDIAGNLMRQTLGTNLEQQGEGVNYNEKMAQANDQKQQLDIRAKDLGITGDQLKAALDQGLGRLNLSTGTTVSDLLNKINSGTLQDAAMGNSLFAQALQYSDYYQRSGLYPGQFGTLAGTNPSGVEQTYAGTAGGTFR